MAKLEHYFTRFEEGGFFHIYNRTINKQPMFIDENNRDFFMQKFNLFLQDVIDIYAYCLLGNHFHFLIKVEKSLKRYRQKHHIKPKVTTHEIVSKQFRRFFQSYALSFNHQQNRCGTLFQTPFKRARVKDEKYLLQLVHYIHTNPQKHGLIDDFKKWKWSSYHEILGKNPSKIQKEILSWFGNKKGFLNFHDMGLTNFDHIKNYADQCN